MNIIHKSMIRQVMLLVMVSFMVLLAPFAFAQSEDFSVSAQGRVSVCSCFPADNILSIANIGAAASVYTITLGGEGASLVAFEPISFQLLPGQSFDVPADVKGVCDVAGQFPLQFLITSSTGLQKQVNQILDVNSCEATLTVSPVTSFQSIDPCETAEYEFMLTNFHPFTETVSLDLDRFAANTLFSENPVLLDPGEQKKVVIHINPACDQSGLFFLQLSATATNAGTVHVLPDLELLISARDIPEIAGDIFTIKINYSSNFVDLPIKNLGDEKTNYSLALEAPTWVRLEPDEGGEEEKFRLLTDPSNETEEGEFNATIVVTVDRTGLEYAKTFTLQLREKPGLAEWLFVLHLGLTIGIIILLVVLFTATLIFRFWWIHPSDMRIERKLIKEKQRAERMLEKEKLLEEKRKQKEEKKRLKQEKKVKRQRLKEEKRKEKARQKELLLKEKERKLKEKLQRKEDKRKAREEKKQAKIRAREERKKDQLKAREDREKDRLHSIDQRQKEREDAIIHAEMKKRVLKEYKLIPKHSAESDKQLHELESGSDRWIYVVLSLILLGFVGWSFWSLGGFFAQYWSDILLGIASLLVLLVIIKLLERRKRSRKQTGSLYQRSQAKAHIIKSLEEDYRVVSFADVKKAKKQLKESKLKEKIAKKKEKEKLKADKKKAKDTKKDERKEVKAELKKVPLIVAKPKKEPKRKGYSRKGILFLLLFLLFFVGAIYTIFLGYGLYVAGLVFFVIILDLLLRVGRSSKRFRIPEAGPGSVMLALKWKKGLEEMHLDLKKPVKDAVVQVKRHKKNPVFPAPNGRAYQFFEVTSHLQAPDLGKVLFRFKVKKSWLKKYQIKDNDVTLMRFSKGRWSSLSSKMVLDDSHHLYFEATSTGLSFFAICGKPTIKKESLKEKKPEKKKKGKKPSLSNIFLFGATVILLLLIIALVVYFVTKPSDLDVSATMEKVEKISEVDAGSEEWNGEKIPPFSEEQGIPVQLMKQGKVSTLNLSSYFADPDEDTLVFSSSKVKGVTVAIESGIATFTPDPFFAGNATLVFTADDSRGGMVNSNLVTLVVEKNDPLEGVLGYFVVGFGIVVLVILLFEAGSRLKQKAAKKKKK